MALGEFQWAQVISSVALLVAGTNAYFSFFRKARLRPRFGETLMLQLAENDRLRVKPELMLYNPGSTLAVVHRLSWELRRLSDDSRESLIWEENLTTVFSETDGRRKTNSRFESFPSALSIPGGDALSKRLQLATEHPFELLAGDYSLTVEVSSDGTRPRTVVTRTTVRLTNEDITFLRANQLGGKQHGPPDSSLFLSERRKYRLLSPCGTL
ncbi:hypothetical protein AWB68_04423 [Caballeronia choica]|uniref:Uncharacterized protein n=1 Tax=Caballeronia choica TaxID=326476 RepID=A0A158JX42_9BURK|nr:hypothetical protein [Caballeronia choica]SAL73406.1 hypothetical protein AWB68_04423 [Caballeronia choica]